MWKFTKALSIALVSMASFSAYSADSVQVGGMTVTCTNTCVVSTSNGRTTVRDCCGGTVSGTFQVPRIEE